MPVAFLLLFAFRNCPLTDWFLGGNLSLYPSPPVTVVSEHLALWNVLSSCEVPAWAQSSYVTCPRKSGSGGAETRPCLSDPHTSAIISRTTLLSWGPSISLGFQSGLRKETRCIRLSGYSCLLPPRVISTPITLKLSPTSRIRPGLLPQDLWFCRSCCSFLALMSEL